MWNYEPQAVSLTDKLLTTYKQRISSLELEASGGGCFELKVGDELVYSKLESGEFPDEDALVKKVGDKLGWVTLDESNV